MQILQTMTNQGRLRYKIQELGRLDAYLVLGTFSAGRLQLLSLVRAMLQLKGILFLGEAASNVDNNTDRKVYDIIFDE